MLPIQLEIRRILSGIGWPIVIPEFNPPYDLVTWDVCDLVSNTHDGFPEPESEVHYDPGPDPPYYEDVDQPHCEDISDPPHWED